MRLQADDAPLKEIAAELGFCDEFHFSKLFKRRTGLSPSAYRTQVLGGMK
jgi:two-component system response regulator YesN